VAEANGDATADERVRALAAALARDGGRFERALQGLTGAESLEVPITGHSMGHALTDGAVARVALDRRAPSVGDVVVFWQDQRLIAHRVVYLGRQARAAGHLITRGDARIAPDPPVPIERVLGRITSLTTSADASPPAPARVGSWPARCARATLGLATALALHVSPALAGRLTALFVLAERRALPWLWRRLRSRLAGRTHSAAIK
jgi:hypothetical protein